MIKVGKDGTVTRDDGVIGRVMKRALEAGLYETERGVSATSGGKVQWFGFDAAGQPLNTTGLDTRKRALERVVKNAEPLIVEDMKREEGPGGTLISASVKWAGNYCGVSRYPSESAWIVDCLIVAGVFFPKWSNGTGTRYTQSRALQGEQAAAADAEAIRLGLLVPAPTATEA
jgi:hypothetical protein